MDVNRYLQRIAYDGPLTPTAETLRALHVAHLMTVPFENLDIPLGRPIVLNNDALFAKIVERRRGGFCYELNGLFAALLRELGFKVEMLAAGVFRDDGQPGPDFDHMALMVTLDQRWLVDVGFGESFREPLLLDETQAQVQGDHAYRIDQDGASLDLMQRKEDGDWTPQYRFTTTAHHFADYEARCTFQQTSPDSHFTQGRICTRATPDGRVTLSDMRLITTINGEKQERTLQGEAEYAAVLFEKFGVILAP